MSRWLRVIFLFGLGLALSLVIGWWFMQLLREDEEEPEYGVRTPAQWPANINIPLPPQPIDDLEVDAPPADSALPARTDDLTLIEGIGPKYAATLQVLGITSFALLAQQDSETLAQQLKEQGVRVSGERIRDNDWVGQAGRLAAG